MKPLKYSNYRLLVMTKGPELGRVKTRMQPYLTPQQSLALHLALINNTATKWQQDNICPMHLWVDGVQQLLFEAIPILGKLPCFVQCAGDLGDKMYRAVVATLSSSSIDGVILLGTDCPFINKDYLQSALTALHTGDDAIIGPAADGGYVLLGIKQPEPSLFENINWGSNTVLSTTIERLDALTWKYRQLPTLRDIDRPEDLLWLDNHRLTKPLRTFSGC
jgi:uncharacterized protein